MERTTLQQSYFDLIKSKIRKFGTSQTGTIKNPEEKAKQLLLEKVKNTGQNIDVLNYFTYDEITKAYVPKGANCAILPA